MPRTISLPEWASFRLDAEGEPRKNGASLIIDVDANAMYPAMLDAYRELYADAPPAEFLDEDGELKPEWAEALEDLNSDAPSAYWLEVAYQSMKLELQLAARTPALNLVVKGDKSLWAQAGRDTGPRKTAQAAGGPTGGREAREHFKRLNGFLPA